MNVAEYSREIALSHTYLQARRYPLMMEVGWILYFTSSSACFSSSAATITWNEIGLVVFATIQMGITSTTNWKNYAIPSGGGGHTPGPQQLLCNRKQCRLGNNAFMWYTFLFTFFLMLKTCTHSSLVGECTCHLTPSSFCSKYSHNYRFGACLIYKVGDTGLSGLDTHSQSLAVSSRTGSKCVDIIIGQNSPLHQSFVSRI